MRKLSLLVFLLLCFTAGPALARENIQGDCMRGNVSVTLQGISSTTKVEGSFPGCTITVYLHGTVPTTLATLYSDNSGSHLGNPFTADSAGHWFFYVDNGRYDIVHSGTGITIPFTIADVMANDPQQTLLNVMDAPYFATCDDSADDTTAIQRAADDAHALGGAVLWFPQLCKITDQIMLYTNTILDGPTYGGIHQATAYTPGITPEDGTLGTDITIRNITLEGTFTHATYPNGSIGVNAHIVGTDWNDQTDANWAGARISFDNVYFKNWGQNCAHLTPNGRIRNSTLEDCYSEGILTGGDNSQILDNKITNTGSWAIDVTGNNPTVRGNKMTNIGDSAVQAWDGGCIFLSSYLRKDINKGVIDGNTCTTGDINGILLYTPATGVHELHNIVISNNVVDSVWGDPATLGDVDIGAIGAQNNGNPSYPIYDISFSNNTIKNAGWHGYLLQDVRDVTIDHPIIDGVVGGTDQKGDGIYIKALQISTPVPPKNITISNGLYSNYGDSAIYAVGGVSANQISGLVIRGANYAHDPTALGGCCLSTVRLAHVIDSVVDGFTIKGDVNRDGIYVDQSSGNIDVINNNISGAYRAIVHDASGGYIRIKHNTVTGNTIVPPISRTGLMTGVELEDNTGFNPLGSLAYAGIAPAVPSSTVPYVNAFGFDCAVYVTAGGSGATVVTITDAGGHALPSETVSTSAVGRFPVKRGYSITLTYASTPTWVWDGH